MNITGGTSAANICRGVGSTQPYCVAIPTDKFFLAAENCSQALNALCGATKAHMAQRFWEKTEPAAPACPGMQLPAFVAHFFGPHICTESFIKGYTISHENFSVREIAITPNYSDSKGKTMTSALITSYVSDSTGRAIGFFSMKLSLNRNAGSLQANGNYCELRECKRRGIARNFFQRHLAFLRHCGLEERRLTAYNQGVYVWPRLGFDFVKKAECELMKKALAEWISKKHQASFSEFARLIALTHAWEFEYYKLDDGTPIGREFLLHGFNEDCDLHFKLADDYPGWRLLFPLSVK